MSEKTYRWNTPHEWLLEFLGHKAAEHGLYNEVKQIITLLDADDIQDIYQSEMEADGFFDPDEEETPRCYYDDESCTGELWQCEVCEEWYCQTHSHETSAGKNVECVECESAREENRLIEITGLVEKLTRPQIVEILENWSIACFDEESNQLLRECLIENVADGTIPEEDLYTYDD